MSGCDVRINEALNRLVDERMAVGLTSPEAFVAISQARTRVLDVLCDCDHGEDDPCCSETETPEEPPDEVA